MISTVLFLNTWMLATCEKSHGSRNSVENIFKDLELDQFYKNHKEDAEKIINEAFSSNTTLINEMESLLYKVLELKKSIDQELKTGMDIEMIKEMKVAVLDLISAFNNNFCMGEEELKNIYELNRTQIKQYNLMVAQCNQTVSELLVMMDKQEE